MGRVVLAGLLLAVGLVLGAGFTLLPGAGAGALLHPARRAVTTAPPPACADETFTGEGVRLRGWRCRPALERRGTLIYLHGVADNRASSAGLVDRFLPRGVEVIAFDSRAHGDSEGDVCTYGFYEKRDLARVIDTLGPGPIVVVGTSLGAAVALQAAAIDARISAVVAAETFSDLRTVAAERAPLIIKAGSFGRAIRLAEQLGRFEVDAVSPLQAAAAITAPVFLVHGAADRDTPPVHSQRVFERLAGPKHLELVPGAGHSGSLQPRVWSAIERWLADVDIIS